MRRYGSDYTEPEMNYRLDGDAIIFFQTAPSLWVWLIAGAVPAFIAGGAIYYMIFKSSGPGERFFYFGFVLFSVPFFLIPMVFNASYEGLSVRLNASSAMAEFYSQEQLIQSFPFEDFASYSLQTETETDDDGDKTTEYTLNLLFQNGAIARLYKTGSADAMQEVIKQARSHLNLPLSDGMNFSVLEEKPVGILIVSSLMCDQPYSSIHSSPSGEGCRLQWSNRPHPALFMGLCIPIVALYFLVMGFVYRGFSFALLLGTVLATALLAALGYAALRSYGSHTFVRLDAARIESWIESPFLGTVDRRSLDRGKIDAMQASIGEGFLSISLYHIPSENGKTVGLSDALQVKSIAIATDSLSAADRIRLIRCFRIRRW
ncbi:MAG: hypothetical protein KDK33_05185 [Leptospiraceae bacterium]|nr:hypothetical protein [Leptospiraceae bacterium]